MVKDLFQQQLQQLRHKLLQAFKNDVSGCIADKTEPFARATDRCLEATDVCQLCLARS